MIRLKVNIFFNQMEVKDVLEKALGTINGVEVKSYSATENEPADFLEQAEEGDVVILEIEGNTTAEIDFVKAIVSEYGEKVSVYVTYSDSDITTMRALMRAGVRDVFTQPINKQEVIAEITEVASSKRVVTQTEQGTPAGVCSFINAKGGSGATTLAVNVAYTLAKEHNSRVALLDFDLQFGGVSLALDLHPSATIMDALIQPERVDRLFLTGIMSKMDDCDLYVLSSPGNATSLANITASSVRKLLQQANEDFDFVIIDLPRIITPWTIEAMKESSPVMLVVQNSLPTIRDAKVIMDSLPGAGISKENVQLVNNRAMGKSGSVSIDRLKEVLGIQYLHRIWNDYQTSNSALDQGLPVFKVSTRSNLTKDINSMAHYLWVMRHGEPTEKKSFITRLFGN